MNEAEKFWQDRAKKLRRFKGLCPLTPEEAEQSLKKVSPQKASDDEIDSIIKAISRGELPAESEEKTP
jgi:hypothetical protein